MDRHDVSAHLAARHLRALSLLLEGMTPEARDLLGFVPRDVGSLASQLEASAPFVPLTDDEKQGVFERLCEEADDMSSKEHARETIADWTDADWRMEKDDQDSYMEEDDDDDDDDDQD